MITSAFVKGLQELLRNHSLDSLTNIPDQLLAEHLAEYLQSLQKTLRLANIREKN